MSSRASALLVSWLVLASCTSHKPTAYLSSDDASTPDAGAPAGPITIDDGGFTLAAWNTQATIFVDGVALGASGASDCRAGMCPHNENTDMIAWKGATYLVHRTAISQVLGPNSSLLVYRSTDGGETFTQVARFLAPTAPIDAGDSATAGRDIRDPCFYVVTAADGTESLHIKALARLPVSSQRDTGVDTIAVGFSSSDGVAWSPMSRLGPNGWSFWRIKEVGGTYYSAAYADGDLSVSLFSSTDGVTWAQGAQIYGVSADTPLETELQAVPSGKLLALVRMDGTDEELYGNDGRLRTKVCWASPPFASWDCSNEIDDERFDGPVSFLWQGRLFVVARRHVDRTPPRCRKRTALFELRGTLDGGPLAVKEWGDLPSGGDTSYAGIVFQDDHRVRVSWYSADVATDADWLVSLLGPANIWLGTIDLSRLQ